MATIQAATPERLRRYYQAHYRPDNAAVVLVGAIDVDAAERELRERFADWQPAAAADALDMGRPQPRQPAVEFVADGAAERLTLAWVQPADLRTPTESVERAQLLGQLAIGVLNQRLADRALAAGSPYVAAQAALEFSLNRLAQVAQLAVVAPAPRWRVAMDAVLDEWRRLLAEGVQPADLQRLVPAMRSHFQAAAAQASTRPSATIADALVQTLHRGGVYTSAAQDLAWVEPVLAGLRADDLTAALRQVFSGTGPVLFRSAQTDAAGAEALAQHLAQALARPLVAPQAQASRDWPYTEFGSPGAVIERQVDAELGTTALRFANGTRLWVRPTAQEKDKIDVQVRLGAGRSGLTPAQTPPLWALDAMALGGTGRLSFAEILQWQQAGGKRVSVAAQVAAHAHVLNASTRPADLLSQLQLLAAYVRDPGFRPEMGEKLAAAGPMVMGQIEAQPGAVYRRLFQRVTSGGDARLVDIPTREQVAAFRPEDVAAAWRQPLQMAPDILIVGDTDVDTAVAAVQASFGAGPERPRAERRPLRVQLPAPGSRHEDRHGGRSDQAVLGQLWALPDSRSAAALRPVAQVLAAIVQTRLVDTVRERLGITYSPHAEAHLSWDVEGQGYLVAAIETPPPQFDTFAQLLAQQWRQLAEQPVSADELQRAKQPLVEARRKAPETHAFWLAWMARLIDQPALKPVLLGEIAALEAVSAEQVQALVRTHIAGRAPVDLVVQAR